MDKAGAYGIQGGAAVFVERIDGDYFNADNEGHIFIKMTNCGDKPLTVEKGKAFAQGVFLPFGITVDDESDRARTGGFGSTDATF